MISLAKKRISQVSIDATLSIKITGLRGGNSGVGAPTSPSKKGRSRKIDFFKIKKNDEPRKERITKMQQSCGLNQEGTCGCGGSPKNASLKHLEHCRSPSVARLPKSPTAV